MDDRYKLLKAIENIKSSAKCVFSGTIVNEETFNTIEWEVNESFTKTNPHSEITWTKVKEEMDAI